MPGAVEQCRDRVLVVAEKVRCGSVYCCGPDTRDRCTHLLLSPMQRDGRDSWWCERSGSALAMDGRVPRRDGACRRAETMGTLLRRARVALRRMRCTRKDATRSSA